MECPYCGERLYVQGNIFIKNGAPVTGAFCQQESCLTYGKAIIFRIGEKKMVQIKGRSISIGDHMIDGENVTGIFVEIPMEDLKKMDKSLMFTDVVITKDEK